MPQLHYYIAGKFGKFGELSVLRQTKSSKLVLTINNPLADLPNFLSSNAQKESIHQTYPLPNFPTIWYVIFTTSLWAPQDALVQIS